MGGDEESKFAFEWMAKRNDSKRCNHVRMKKLEQEKQAHQNLKRDQSSTQIDKPC